MEFTTIGRIEPEHFQNYTQINLGDATLLTSLQALNQGRSTIVLDQNSDVMAELMAELSSEAPVFGFLKHKKYHYQYASISEKILKDAALTAEMNRAYNEAWQGAQSKLGNLTFIESSIESAAAEIKTPKAVADLVTCYYPSPQFSPIFKTLELASLLLKPEGELVIASENSSLTNDFAGFAGQFVTKSGYVKRNGGQYLSTYDIAWGQKGHYEVRIKNKNNKLHEHISTMKQSFVFRAMSALGMVR